MSSTASSLQPTSGSVGLSSSTASASINHVNPSTNINAAHSAAPSAPSASSIGTSGSDTTSHVTNHVTNQNPTSISSSTTSTSTSTSTLSSFISSRSTSSFTNDINNQQQLSSSTFAPHLTSSSLSSIISSPSSSSELPVTYSTVLSSSQSSSTSKLYPQDSSTWATPMQNQPSWTTTSPIHPLDTTTNTIYHHKPHSHHPHGSFRPDRLATVDLIIVVVYICLLLSTSISAMIRARKSHKRHKAQTGRSEPAMAGRKMNWFTVGTSIFASNLGSEHFIGLSGSAAATGLSVAAFEINALIILQLSSWIFLPVLIVSKISTLPEYMQKRFGGKRIRTYLAVLSILLYIFTKISVNLYSGGIFIQQAVGWNLYTSAMFILALTSIMTVTGGVKGAMMIDNMQAFVMTLGASIVSTKALVAIGGWDGLKRRYMDAVPSKVPANLTHCAQPNPLAFQMLRPWNDRDMPWLGFILGQTTASIWYWCADQMLVQRFLSARSLAHVQGSAVFSGYLKGLSFIFMVIPGMISRCLFTDEVSCIDPEECRKFCQSTVSCSNTAYPRLVLELMPMGARGMLVAAMVAALMNDLCNVFNSASALFACDIWPLFRSHPSSKEQALIGRVFVFVLVIASIMWIPVIQEMQGGQLFIYIQAVSGLFAPPITAVYMCAVLWTRTNEAGAFWAMMVGFGLAIVRLVLSFMYKEPSCGQTIDERPWLLHIHYMYYSAFLFFAAGGAAILISHLTKPPAPFRLIRTTFWTRFDTQIRKDDKNVFEMKYTGKTSSSRDGSMNSTSLLTTRTSLDDVNSEAGLSDRLVPSPQPSQLFTIEEQQEKKTADLSSIIVDIHKEAAKNVDQQQRSQSQPNSPGLSKPSPVTPSKPALTHQTSLSGAVGAASEAGKMIASKLASEGAKAKDIVLAAATHLKKPTQSTQIKFQNLQPEDEEEDDDDDAMIRPTSASRTASNGDDEERESTNLDGEDEDDEPSGAGSRLQRHKKTRRSGTAQSAISAALNSYKRSQQKSKGGYTKAAAFDEEDEDEEDDEEDQDESAKFKVHRARDLSAGDESSTDDARNTPTLGIGTRKLLPGSNKYRPFMSKKQQSMKQKRKQRQQQSTAANNKHMNLNNASANNKSLAIEYEEPEQGGDLDETNFRCLDNSVALLMKTRVEETFLRIATATIIIVALGIYIIFSIPPTMPDKKIVDMLVEKY